MDEHRTDALQYGRLGTATYLPEVRSWKFSRSPTRSSPLSYVGRTRRTVSPSSRLVSPVSLGPRNKWNLLLNIHPELAAGSSLNETEALSRAISATTDTCDPRVSTLIDLGHAVDLENDASGNRTVPIAVVASGECGDSISFLKIEDEVVEWRQQKLFRARVPSIGNTEATKWAGGGAPVRQICFAQTAEEKATWMAARFSLSTTIFRPLYRRTPISTHYGRNDVQSVPAPLRNSHLDPNPLVDISSSQTGGHPHADVAFNPWYQKQVAIVDECGNWSIWDLSGRQRRSKSNWLATCVKSGSLPWLGSSEGGDSNEQPHHDGWAAIEWVGDVNSLVVCDRRRIILYRLESDSVFSHPIELGLKRRSEWILDIKRSSSNLSHAFILTTSRILWLDTSSVVSASRRDSNPSLVPQLSWRHFRDPEDTTLRLASLQMGDDFLVVLYSRLNNLAQAFQFPLSPEEQDTVPDPFIVQIPSGPEKSADPGGFFYESRFTTIVFKELEHAPSGGRELYDPNIRLIKLFTLDSCYAVFESLYVGPTSDNYVQDTDVSQRHDVLRLRKRAVGVRKSRRSAGEDDGFVVDDWDEPTSAALTLANPRTIPTSNPVVSQWTVDYNSVYSIAIGKTVANARLGFEQLPEKGLEECLEELESKFSDAMFSDSDVSRTMLERVRCSPFLDDIDRNSERFRRLTALLISQDPNGRSRISPYILPLILSFQPATQSSSLQLDVMETYDDLVRDWLSTLPRDIPGRARIVKERVIRNVAAEISFARINLIRNSENLADGPSDDESLGGHNEADSHVRSKDVRGSQGATGDKHAFLISSQGSEKINRAPHYGHDALAANNVVSVLQQYRDKGGPFYAGLHSLTTIKDQGAVPTKVVNILSHWSPGSDPITYDWQRVMQAQENENSRAGDKSTTYGRRARDRVSRSQDASVFIPSSPAVPVVRQWGSQPQEELPKAKLQSSQVAEEDLPMTQVERGVFGGREAGKKSLLKARKKKRAAGF
ncbi:hypothetical protein VTN02DRAFT_6699 [Thermoascus thermophilus]